MHCRRPGARPTRPHGPRPALLAAGGALLLACGCASSGAEIDTSAAARLGDGTATGAEPEPWTPIAERGGDAERSLGKYLADLDNAIRAWKDKTWAASNAQDKSKQDQLELYLEEQARRGQAQLVEQLETGPPMNRIIAATALGFTRDPAALSPLLSALEDPHPLVVQNALIGLSLLQSPDTPLERVFELMRYAEDPATRGSAAYCARCLLEIGAEGGDPASAARGGAVDPDPIVRCQAALILALAEDPEGVEPLELLLSDDVALVASAAARALARLGLELPEVKGECARSLTDALELAEDEPRRLYLVRNLSALAEKNYGKDVEAWVEWSHRLP